ncbi:MAG TPA: FecR domain-containing protein [Chitinophagaceae bacterium]|nr:FecR domain-containing protein [Chitinophagaceae bacterium]
MKTGLPNITDVQLVKYIAAEANQEEVAQVEAWLEQDAENRHHFNQLQAIWQQTAALAPNSVFNEQQAWDRFTKKLAQRPVVKPLPFNAGWWKVAAMVLLVVTGIVTYNIIRRFNIEKPLQIIAGNTALTRVLPDGSTVVLNKHASLEYPSQFNSKERKVTLKGEGFFTVTHNTAQPFVVACGKLNITVVGTAFNVKMGTDTTTVIVEEGKVRVSNEQQSLLLLPGQQASVNNNSGQMQQTNQTDRLYMYYRNRVFVCDATPLWKLVEALNDAYDAHIVIANKELANLPISTTFNNEPLDKILLVIAQTFNARWEKKENSILLK